MNDNRGPWYLLTGVILGLVAGLVYGWVIQPVGGQNVVPSALEPGYIAEYRILIAQAYTVDRDLVRAKARLDLLGDENIIQTLEQQARILQTKPGLGDEAHALARLAADLRQDK
jgi:hypothetical protein